MSGVLELPAFATAHSHAFQRALRGKAQRPATESGTDDFWSWRKAMFGLAESLTPESMHAIARVAYAELFRRGVRTVGEFHYVHHQMGGTPYEDRTILAETMIRAAREEGLRIALLRVVYRRAAVGRAPQGAQTRFCDAKLEDAFRDVEALRAKHARDPNVVIGIAPHSVRAVAPDELKEVGRFAEKEKLVIHAHVAEQRAEVDACLAETKKRPVEHLADVGVLGERFVAVHATHLEAHEAKLLGDSRSRVCLCPTTERDLGDGLPDLKSLLTHGVGLSVGVDSHVVTSPLEEIRAIETAERLRLEKRVVAWRSGDAAQSPAQRLWEIGSKGSARACGFEDAGGTIKVRKDHPDLRLVDDGNLLDAIVFSANADVIEPS
ncbi:MAG: formimidoylglutamate deiminase [Polyangiaceae bacterium]